MADLSSFESATPMPPPSQSTPQPSRTSLPSLVNTAWWQEPAGVEIAAAVAVSEAKPEGVVELLVLLVDFRRDQQLHRSDLLLRMPRQMLGIVAAHEAGIGLVAGRTRIHARIENLRLGLAGLADVVGLFGPGNADEGRKGKRKDKGKLHDRTGRVSH